MKKITTAFAAFILATGACHGAADTSTYYPGGLFTECTSKYINVYGIESLNYRDNYWRLVTKNGWGGGNCALNVTAACQANLINAMGLQEFNDNSIIGVLSNIICSCQSDSDCVSGFKCQKNINEIYGQCLQISNYCTNNNQCDNEKGYICISGKCTQKCYIDTKPENTYWETVKKDSTYNVPMIEKESIYTCASSGWSQTTNYRCAEHYYGTPTSATSTCNRCPAYPGPATSAPGSTLQTDCYIPKGTQYGDQTGSFTIVNNDCHHD